MKIEIQGLTVQPDGTFTGHSKLVEEMEESFDMYQKLDFIIHSLTRDMEHKVIFMKD